MSTNPNPYGGLISSSGTLAGANTMRFSSKPAILSATGAWGFYYYGYRFYDPGMQRWLNRDPLGEPGGINLQTFIASNPVNLLDRFGLIDYKCFGGDCRNGSSRPEWALVNGSWKLLQPGESTSLFEDCDGMTCRGGFYKVGLLGILRCYDDPTPALPPETRWTPTHPGEESVAPGFGEADGRYYDSALTPSGKPNHRGADNATPPGYTYDE